MHVYKSIPNTSGPGFAQSSAYSGSVLGCKARLREQLSCHESCCFLAFSIFGGGGGVWSIAHVLCTLTDICLQSTGTGCDYRFKDIVLWSVIRVCGICSPRMYVQEEYGVCMAGGGGGGKV